uniref:Uncharacterized protein n=1 Tax=Rhizophora mucronata TaxID=61149 RepID=A0A2P2QNA7_RHIMU
MLSKERSNTRTTRVRQNHLVSLRLRKIKGKTWLNKSSHNHFNLIQFCFICPPLNKPKLSCQG